MGIRRIFFKKKLSNAHTKIRVLGTAHSSGPLCGQCSVLPLLIAGSSLVTGTCQCHRSLAATPHDRDAVDLHELVINGVRLSVLVDCAAALLEREVVVDDAEATNGELGVAVDQGVARRRVEVAWLDGEAHFTCLIGEFPCLMRVPECPCV